MKVSEFKKNLFASAKAKQGLLENIVIDESTTDVIRLTVSNACIVTVSNHGRISKLNEVSSEVIELDLKKISKEKLAGLLCRVVIDGYRSLKDIADSDKKAVVKLSKSHVAGRFLSELVPVLRDGKDFDDVVTTKIVAVRDYDSQLKDAGLSYLTGQEGLEIVQFGANSTLLSCNISKSLFMRMAKSGVLVITKTGDYQLLGDNGQIVRTTRTDDKPKTLSTVDVESFETVVTGYFCRFQEVQAAEIEVVS